MRLAMIPASWSATNREVVALNPRDISLHCSNSKAFEKHIKTSSCSMFIKS